MIQHFSTFFLFEGRHLSTNKPQSNTFQKTKRRL